MTMGEACACQDLGCAYGRERSDDITAGMYAHAMTTFCNILASSDIALHSKGEAISQYCACVTAAQLDSKEERCCSQRGFILLSCCIYVSQVLHGLLMPSLQGHTNLQAKLTPIARRIDTSVHTVPA